MERLIIIISEHATENIITNIHAIKKSYFCTNYLKLKNYEFAADKN